MIKKQKSFIKCIHVITDDGLYYQKAFYKVKIVFFYSSSKNHTDFDKKEFIQKFTKGYMEVMSKDF